MPINKLKSTNPLILIAITALIVGTAFFVVQSTRSSDDLSTDSPAGAASDSPNDQSQSESADQPTESPAHLGTFTASIRNRAGTDYVNVAIELSDNNFIFTQSGLISRESPRMFASNNPDSSFSALRPFILFPFSDDALFNASTFSGSHRESVDTGGDIVHIFYISFSAHGTYSVANSRIELVTPHGAAALDFSETPNTITIGDVTLTRQ